MRTTSLLLLLAFAGRAQDTRPRPASRPVISLRIGEPRMAAVVDAVAGVDVPDLEEGEACTIAWDGALKPSEPRVEKATAPSLLVDVLPVPLLAAIPKKELADAKWRFESAVKLALAAASIDAKAATQVAAAIWDFPAQVDRVRLEVRLTEGKAGNARLSLTPVTSSGFAKVLDKLRPLPSGAPVLAAGDPIMLARVALAMEPLDPLVQSFLQPMVGLMYKDEARATMTAWTMRYMHLMAGDAVMAWGPDGMSSISGSHRPEELAAFVNGPEFGAYYELMNDSTFVESATFKPAALTWRDVKVGLGVQTVRKSLTANNPLVPKDGTTSEYIAAARNWLIMAASEAEAKRLIDQALDGKLKRAPLPAGQFVEIEMDLARLTPAAGLPIRRARLSVGLAGGALTVNASWE